MAKAVKKLSALTNVELIVGDHRETFKADHAERILRMRKNGGWKLPEDSPLEFTEKDGLNRRSNKGEA